MTTEAITDADAWKARIKRGGSFIFDDPGNVSAVWGEGEQILWAQGEPLMIAAPEGTGKSTTAQQLILRLCGVVEGPLLGLPVKRQRRPGVYLALDRPRQIRRSMRRMVRDADQEQLDKRLIVWDEPLPMPFEEFDDFLNELCPRAGWVVVDSLKDFAVGLSTDEVGAQVNKVWQSLSARGIDLLVLHHDRKTMGSETRTNPSVSDIYGSRWLTAGMGSVLMYSGQPGDQDVTMHHVKQPLEPVGPMVVHYDRSTGAVTRGEGARVDHMDKYVDEVVALATADPGIPTSKLQAKMTTATNNDTRQAAVLEAERRGFIDRRKGPNNSKLVFPLDPEDIPDL